jgi:hypothetical protein
VVALAMSALASVQQGDGAGADGFIEWAAALARAASAAEPTAAVPAPANKPWQLPTQVAGAKPSTEWSANELTAMTIAIRNQYLPVGTVCAACGDELRGSRTTDGTDSWCNPSCQRAWHNGARASAPTRVPA